MSRRGSSRTGHASGTAGYTMPGRSEIAGFSGQGSSAFAETTGGARWQPACPHGKHSSACRKCTPGGDRAAQGRRAHAAQEPQEPAPEPVPDPDTPE